MAPCRPQLWQPNPSLTMFFNRLRVAHKLWSTLLLLLLAVVALGGFTLYGAGKAYRQSLAAMTAANALIEQSMLWKGLTEAAVIRSMASAISADPAVGELFKANVAGDADRVAKVREDITKQATSPADQAQLKDIVAKGAALLAASRKARDLGAAGDRAAAIALVHGEYSAAARAYLESIDVFVELQRRKGADAAAAADRAREASASWGAAGAVVVVLLGMLVAWWLVRSIRQPLQESIRVASAIADGDLTQRIDARRLDEFGELMRALQHMNGSLANIVGKVRSSTDSIATASSEIAQGNADLSHRTEQTASSLQSTASSMEQLTATVQQTAGSAGTASQLVASASEVASRGGQVVSQVVSTMSDINTSSKKISDIIGVIDGIAFQTNILALNAAVEAARAGEQGRGFAVVASEVRNLAGRSAEAAKEIKGLIGASVEKVESGTQLVADAGRTMEEIVHSVQRVNDIIGEIRSATSEQSQGISGVNRSVAELDQMTQQNSALVEQSSAAAQSLREQAQGLAALVSVFRVGGVQESRPALPG
ncbi:methyl-accepting chemotaxis protein [Pseudorhodoferax aquiterrae]|uniref:Methyl-accepting chemotaxis protein n=2 Tax=Pseudorhodoferax aquiterrae TaxID=747304 RepID=A0ABQ3G2V0_9BURK|nr:methyl-accepting chemotaxis protein [Pseudorhodoferax aquiterrae]